MGAHPPRDDAVDGHHLMVDPDKQFNHEIFTEMSLKGKKGEDAPHQEIVFSVWFSVPFRGER